jgi:hypothetical protein
VHYFPAGATLYGTEAKVAYEYAGKTYAGRFTHMPAVSTCTGCHQPHTGEVKIERCGGCHAGVNTVADLANIRMSTKGDIDGNGKEEGLGVEIRRRSSNSSGSRRRAPSANFASLIVLKRMRRHR